MRNSLTSDRHSEKWGAQNALMSHQVEAVAKLLPSRVGGLFMEMGTGKSRTAIELARLRQEKIDRIIWFCPVSLKTTIRHEIFKHTTCRPDQIYCFDQETTENSVPLDRQWYVVGIESMSSSARALHSVISLIDDRTMIIVDESTYIKGHRAKRTERITRISEQARYRLILTGTPITQGVVDLYAQMRFLSPKIFGYKSFYSFAANHLKYSACNRGQIVRSLDVDWLTERIRPYVYQVTKEECLTLPKKLYSPWYCELTKEQLSAYQAAKDDFFTDLLLYDDDRWDGLSNGIAVFRLFSRLQAIACGLFGGHELPQNRIDLLEDIITTRTDSHIVIWTKYLASIRQIEERLKANRRPVYRFDGSLTEKQRDKSIEDWQTKGGVLVATQSLGGHGLDLTAASTVFFYSSGFKYSEHLQAEDRCHRIGQERPVTYVRIWADCGIEDRIRLALEKKKNVLEMFRKEVDKVKKTSKTGLRAFINSL